MTVSLARKFTLADSMILIAVTAVGLWLLRAHLDGFHEWAMTRSAYSPNDYPAWMNRLPHKLQIACVVPLLVSLSLAVLAFQLVKPRRSLGRLARTPGASACLAIGFGITLDVVSNARMILELSFQKRVLTGFDLLLRVDDSFPRIVGTSIGAVWFLLFIGGGWRRRETDWRGQLGRILGWAWLLLFVLYDFRLGLFRVTF